MRICIFPSRITNGSPTCSPRKLTGMACEKFQSLSNYFNKIKDKG